MKDKKEIHRDNSSNLKKEFSKIKEKITWIKEELDSLELSELPEKTKIKMWSSWLNLSLSIQELEETIKISDKIDQMERERRARRI